MALPIPLPSLGFSSGPAVSGATSAGSITLPTVVDHSGWNVMIRSSGSQTATGSTGAGTAGAPGGIPTWMLLAAAGWFLFQ